MAEVQHIRQPARYCLRRAALLRVLNSLDRQALIEALQTLVDDDELMEHFRGEIETLLIQ